MAFATNSSAFGIKPAGGNSIFGQSTAPKPAGGGLFGGGSTTTNPLFGGGQQQQQQQQPASTGLFGQSNQQQQPASTGLFGQPAANTQQQQPASTGLFGQPAANTQQQQPASTGLFGQPAANTQQQPSTGLFGQPANNNQQQPSTGLFGQPAANTQQQQPQQQGGLFGNSLFGNSTTQNQSTTQPAQQSSIFGSQPAQGSTWGASSLQGQQTQPAGSSAWGSTTATAGGSSLFGQPKSQPLGASTAQPSGQVPFTKSTKFNDLPDEMKKTFENIDAHIQGRVQISQDLKQRKLGEEPTKGQELIRGVHKDLVNATSILRSDVLYTRDLKAKADQAVQDTIVATRIIDGFRNPQQNGQYLKNHASFPLEFFNRITEQMRERLHWYKNTIEQIERKLSSTASQAQYTPQAISATLQAQHATFISLASKTAALDADLQKIKALYTQLWRQKTGSVRDPFNDLDRSGGADFGLDGLHVK
ncbi:hypothetical protein PLICRDRAFT_94672 [Plicaturopsis crispa FD-325 SS-3]|uniref:Nucleoporin Nup54 alpha-helical domain-containing protein n=1 Tax=Plicaturopsis crispa FD-325 SS-3 TaxID=944288 RepID=A0A0C9T6Z8_PLICR|nr:hypothetical protein PLICRDRAFT_94672 [Plicaturopsis crispa FD-325 SS-3]